MLEQLKEEVLKANKALKAEKLAILTWGNVSAYDEKSGLVVIKASGVEYDAMTTGDLVVTDLDGKVVEGRLNPSTDLKTHLEIYKNFKGARGAVHTHSPYATMWAQAGLPIACYGTTHADYFNGEIPCTRQLTEEEINGDYEENTGKVIAEAFEGKDPDEASAVLVACHGPFVWGGSAQEALENSIVLENVAMMAMASYSLLRGGTPLISKELMDKHYYRKHGKNAYYGQGG